MQCFGSGVQCFGPVIYQALCTSMLGKELSTGVVNMGLGEPGPRPSYVPAELSPVPEGYVPSAIDESAQQQKWGSRIGGEHHGAELWRLYSTHGARAVDDFTHNLMADVSSMEGGHCSNLFELASGNKGAWPARSVSRAIRATPSKSRTWADMPPTFLRARGRKLCRQPDRSARSDRLFQTLLFWILRVCAARSH